MKFKTGFQTALISAAVACACGAQAADWSDTSLTYKYGTKFAEPFGTNDITKNILNLSHASGYKYGSNFFSVDMLMSDSKDPGYGDSSYNGYGSAQETYIVYRNTVDLEKTTGMSFKAGPMRALGITAGFDYNSKADAGYNSKKRMLVLGPTVSFDVPGFLNVGVLMLWESNAPYSTYTSTGVSRYSYDVHPMLDAAWSIPFKIGPVPLAFEGYTNIIAPKGKDEYGDQTATEVNFDGQIMYDLGAVAGTAPNTFKVGFEYQWWRNKFGNNYKGAAGSGAFAKTPMIRAEYHF